MGGRKSPSARRRRALGRNRSQRQGGLLVARQTNNGTQHGSGEHGVRAFVFPGQGSQSVGMGKALAEASAAAREVFQEVDDALGQNLFRLMTEGTEDQLTLTEHAQPAILDNAIATLRVMEKQGGMMVADKVVDLTSHSPGDLSDKSGAAGG